MVDFGQSTDVSTEMISPFHMEEQSNDSILFSWLGIYVVCESTDLIFTNKKIYSKGDFGFFFS